MSAFENGPASCAEATLELECNLPRIGGFQSFLPLGGSFDQPPPPEDDLPQRRVSLEEACRH